MKKLGKVSRNLRSNLRNLRSNRIRRFIINHLEEGTSFSKGAAVMSSRKDNEDLLTKIYGKESVERMKKRGDNLWDVGANLIVPECERMSRDSGRPIFKPTKLFSQIKKKGMVR